MTVLLAATLLQAEVTLVLKSGQRITGTVLFENEEVMVIKDADGKRYQYPQTEIQEVVEGVAPEQKEEVKRVAKGKLTGMSVHIGGGAGWLPKYNAGGSLSGDAYIGACNVAQRHIFIGGGLGYHAYVSGGQWYHFIPLQVRFSAPLTQTRHAPAIGASLGYGFLPKGKGKGGLHGGLDVGWRCQLQERAALFAGVNATMQQAPTDVEEHINNQSYTHHAAIRTFCSIGLKVAVQF